MGLSVYNTLSGQKEAFIPLTPGQVTMYVCGVTVYDYSHIGHARSAMVFDVIRQYLEYRGYEVRFVKNFTDVDDKIIKRAFQEGRSAQEVAETYIAAYHEDMAQLGIRPANIEPRATEHIDEMLNMIQQLVAEGFAYPVSGDVYFAVNAFAEYGKLSKRQLDDSLAGARVEVDDRKRNPLDFALWKASKPGEPVWDSPWGPGRPGWHIECSAMSRRYLGETFDIHGGGRDLIFPHHENEIAQSEACTKKPLATYWLHNGFVNNDQEKMSKSLGNFFTIREVLEKFSPEAIRFLMLSTHYRSPVDYADVRLTESAAALKRFEHTFHDVAELQARVRPDEQAATLAPEAQAVLAQLSEHVARGIQAFETAMDDDFNTAAALGSLFDMLKAINSAVRPLAALPFCAAASLMPLTEAVAQVKRLAGVLGFTFAAKPAASNADRQLLEQLIGLTLELRKEARMDKNWKFADRIRAGLSALGIQVQDLPGGQSAWTVER